MYKGLPNVLECSIGKKMLKNIVLKLLCVCKETQQGKDRALSNFCNSLENYRTVVS